ncbi:MAG TPA: caspase family protein [Leptospiraceae bacterium]|nr:caspase family protein [Leptospiraceae bacterium]HNM05391.1 caspase family protein [Leptospiraceae bacterium]HNN06303.1 caspase family protein [Leptospiraceae bacterium]
MKEKKRICSRKLVSWILCFVLAGSFSVSAEEKTGVGFKTHYKKREHTGRKKFALLVGVKESEKKGFGTLANAEKDIAEIERNLVQKGDFTVKSFNSNPKLKEVTDWMDKFVTDLPEGSVFLFFFSGHGTAAQDGSTLMYLYDSDQSNEVTALKESKLLEKLLKKNEGLPVGKKIDIILFINACRTANDEAIKTISKEYQNREQGANVTRFYSSQIGQRSIDNSDKATNALSLFTFRFVQAINNSAIPKKPDEKESNKPSEQKVSNAEDTSFFGADSTVNGGNGDRKITLVEIKKFMDRVFKNEIQKPEDFIADGMQDFPLVDLNKSYDTLRYIWRSAVMPGWGEWNYGVDYNERISGKISYYTIFVYPVIYVGLIGKTVADFRVYSNRQNAFRNQPILPAQPLGQDTFIYNFLVFNDKKYKLEQATARYNESAAVLFGFWFFNVAQSWLVPWLNSGSAPFSAQLDMRPVYGSQELLAGSARWEKYASFGWKNQF